MWTNYLNKIQGLRRSLLIISLIPILLLGFSFISYGMVFNPFFTDNVSSLYFFKLPNLLSFFGSDVALPLVVKIIGRMCAFSLSIIFLAWLIMFTIRCYLELSQQIGNKVELILELVIISLVYYYIISPPSFVTFLLGLLLIVVNLGLIVLYGIYELKTKK